MTRSQATPIVSQMITMERMLSERDDEIEALMERVAELEERVAELESVRKSDIAEHNSLLDELNKERTLSKKAWEEVQDRNGIINRLKFELRGIYDALDHPDAGKSIPAWELIRGMQQELDALRSQEPVGYFYNENGFLKQAGDPVNFPGLKPLYAAPVLEQEPVAWQFQGSATIRKTMPGNHVDQWRPLYARES